MRQLSAWRTCYLAHGKHVRPYLQNDFQQITIACDDCPRELRGPLAGWDFNETAQLTSMSCTSAYCSSATPTSHWGDADYGPAVRSGFMNPLLGGLDLHFPFQLQEGGLGWDSAFLRVCRLVVASYCFCKLLSCSWDSHHRRASWGLVFVWRLQFGTNQYPCI